MLAFHCKDLDSVSDDLSEIRGGQCFSGAGFSAVSLLSPANPHSTIAP
jgi:hypothetical protein